MKARKFFMYMVALICIQVIFTGGYVAAEQPASSADELIEGIVRKIDKDVGKITIRHGEIKSLDMPPMTMIYRVKDKSLLDSVQTGDKIKFKAINEGGKFMVTDIHPEN